MLRLASLQHVLHGHCSWRLGCCLQRVTRRFRREGFSLVSGCWLTENTRVCSCTLILTLQESTMADMTLVLPPPLPASACSWLGTWQGTLWVGSWQLKRIASPKLHGTTGAPTERSDRSLYNRTGHQCMRVAGPVMPRWL